MDNGLRDIVEVREVIKYREVNELLKSGWVLLSVESYKFNDSEGGYDCGHSYSLGLVAE